MATAQSSTHVLRFPALPVRFPWQRATVRRAFAGHTLFRLGVLITLFWLGVALLAPWIAPYSPTHSAAALAKGTFEGEVFHKVLRMHTLFPQMPPLLAPGSSGGLRQGHVRLAGLFLQRWYRGPGFRHTASLRQRVL